MTTTKNAATALLTREDAEYAEAIDHDYVGMLWEDTEGHTIADQVAVLIDYTEGSFAERARWVRNIEAEFGPLDNFHIV